MSELADLLERFRRGPELIAVATTGASNVEIDFVPAAGAWSVRQICSHVADSELVSAARFRWVLAEEHPTIMAFDQDAWARSLGYEHRRISQALDTFRHLRNESYELLKSQPEAVFSRTANHSKRGTITVLDLLRLMADHAEKHSQQILRTREQYKASKQ